MRQRAVLVAILGLLAACTGDFAADDPDWIVNRLPLASCGVETIETNGLSLDAVARGCLLAAFQDGEGAELISTQMTEEGDPVTRYYRVHENGTGRALRRRHARPVRLAAMDALSMRPSRPGR